MKITFVEEIEARKAWRNSMCCPQCNEYKYKIHHQLKPETSLAWWLECDNCNYESEPMLTRGLAIERWKQC